jgi:hypothetical protein
VHPFKPKSFNLGGKEYFSLQVGYETSVRFYMVPYRTPGFATHAWELQVYRTCCTVVVLNIIYLGRRIIGRLLGTSACDGEQILLLQSLGLSITPVGAVYFGVSSFFLVTRVPTEYSYTDGEISPDFAKMLIHGLLPIFKNQCFG